MCHNVDELYSELWQTEPGQRLSSVFRARCSARHHYWYEHHKCHGHRSTQPRLILPDDQSMLLSLQGELKTRPIKHNWWNAYRAEGGSGTVRINDCMARLAQVSM